MAKGRKSRNKPPTNPFSQPTPPLTASVPTDDVPQLERLGSQPPVTSHINARPHLEAGALNGRSKWGVRLSALAHTTIPMWVQTFVIITLIFGGCCSNVFALEVIVKEEPQCGHLITFAQFIMVSIEGFYYHFDPKSSTLLKPNQIPLTRWLGQIMMFFTVSVMNNYAFGFNISVPVHIILRSGGSVSTMLIGYLFGKRYSRLQVAAVFMLSVGVVISALGDGKAKQATSETSSTEFITGLTVLFVAQIMSAFMGLYVETTYTKYGSNWREGLFYTHALALPLFGLFYKSISSSFNALLASPPLPIKTYASYAPIPVPSFISDVRIPTQLFFLLLNALTQYLCIRGVNILGAVSSALTVTIVLNIRKLISLLLSVWLFGNELHMQVVLGATVVFGGGFLYGIESQRLGQKRRRLAAAAGGKKVQ